jgi:hypothetical protein
MGEPRKSSFDEPPGALIGMLPKLRAHWDWSSFSKPWEHEITSSKVAEHL